MKKTVPALSTIFNFIRPGKVTILRAFVISLFSFLYSLYAVKWTNYYPSGQLLLLELPLLWIIYTIFHFVHRDHSKWRRIVCEISPLLIIFTMYYFYDFFFVSWNRTPRFNDMKNIPSLVGVWGVMGFIVKALPIIILCTALALQIRNYYKSQPEKNMFKSLFLRTFYFLAIFVLLNTSPGRAYLYDVMRFQQLPDSSNMQDQGKVESYNMQQQGRLASMFYYEQKYSDQLTTIQQEIEALSRNSSGVVENIKFDRKPNTYIVLLESFFDPHEFKQFQLDRSVIYDGLKKYLPNSGKFNLIKVPVFGAGTAQSEFEILTGAPALHMLDTIEFNSLNGSPTYSICRQFLANNYRCEALVATSPGFYNSIEAYESLNFQHVNYLNRENSCLKIEQVYDFPRDSQILPLAINQQQKFEQPFLGYIVTMFGHKPYRRDTTLYPDVVVAKDRMTGKKLPGKVNDCINGIYYKTKDMAGFLDMLYEKDPSAVVFMFADHLPDVSRDYAGSYVIGKEDAQFYTPAMLIDSGKPVKMEAETLYEVHYQILNMLSKDPVKIHADAEVQKKRYLKIMHDGIKENDTDL